MAKHWIGQHIPHGGSDCLHSATLAVTQETITPQANRVGSWIKSTGFFSEIGTGDSGRLCRSSLSNSPIPANMAMTNTTPLRMPEPINTNAGPGQIPANPQRGLGSLSSLHHGGPAIGRNSPPTMPLMPAAPPTDRWHRAARPKCSALTD